MPAVTRSARRRALLEQARAAEANASATNAPAANAPTASAPAVNAPTVSVPTLAETAPTGLMAPATARNSNAGTGRFVAGQPQAGSSSNSAPRTTRRRRLAPFSRPIRRSSSRPRAAHGRRGASATIFDTPQPDGERGLVERRHRSEEGPFTLRNPSFADNEGANDYQNQKHPEQDQPDVGGADDHEAPEDQGNRHQWPRVGLREWARQGPRQRVEQEQGQPVNANQPNEESDQVPRPTLISVLRPPVTEPPPGENIGLPVEEILEPGENEAGEEMGWMEATNAVEADRDEIDRENGEQRILLDPCTSPTCPITTSIIPHDRGLYLHNGELNQEHQAWPWGLSNPPPMIWRMARRLEAGTGQPGDQDVVASFVRNHHALLNAHFEAPPI